MRRSDREVTDPNEILSIMARSQVVTLGLWGDDAPYLLPVNFGMEPDGMTLYIHGAMTGKKYDLLACNPHVGFNMIAYSEIVEEGAECSTNYESVSGWGVVEELTEKTEKYEALRRILEHDGHGDLPVDPKVAVCTRVLRLGIRERTGKRRKGKSKC